MVTTREMRLFAADCRRWAHEISNPSDQETLFRAAQTWTKMAVEIDRNARDGGKLANEDLRTKLN
jgi:hypothetical protein